jgi:hypothetical protein
MSFKKIEHQMKECRKLTEVAIKYVEKNEFGLAANQMSWQQNPDKGAMGAILEMRAMLQQLEGYKNELSYLFKALNELQKKHDKGEFISDSDRAHVNRRLKDLISVAENFM